MSIAAAPLSESESLIEVKWSSGNDGRGCALTRLPGHSSSLTKLSQAERAWEQRTYQALETPTLSMVMPPVPSVQTAG